MSGHKSLGGGVHPGKLSECDRYVDERRRAASRHHRELRAEVRREIEAEVDAKVEAWEAQRPGPT